MTLATFRFKRTRKFKGKIRVMDPSNLGYTPFRRHEAIRSNKIAVSCMIGFVRA